MRRLLSVLFVLNIIWQISAQNVEKLRAQYNFTVQTSDWFEGFEKSITANDFSYHSLRDDIQEAMLTRCTDGKMAVEWLAPVVKEQNTKKTATFLWLAAIDLTSEKHYFDVYINDEKKFTIISGNHKDWLIKSNDGGKFGFKSFDVDQHGDAHGYMYLSAPANWLIKGKQLKIKIVGRAENSNTWIIIYKAGDALAYLHENVKYTSWAELSISKGNINSRFFVKLPAHLTNKEISWEIGSKKGKQKAKLSKNKKVSFIAFEEIFTDNSKISVSDSYAELISVSSIKTEGKSIKLLSEALLINKVRKKSDNEIIISSNRLYKPETAKRLIKLSKSNIGSATIYLMNSSHQDIAWMNSPEKCMLIRDTALITPLLEKVISNPNYCFDIEDVLMLREYIQRHPETKETITKLLNEGKLSCGSSYNMPYEEMYSGEALVRQFYLGTKWLKKEFNGYQANVYWNVDVPGRSLQMPQILKKSGTDYMLISRHKEGLFNWYSPDGSYVTTYSPGHYGQSYSYLNKNFFDAAEYLSGMFLNNEVYFDKEIKHPVLPLLSDWDMSTPKDYGDLINKWENITELETVKGKTNKINLPKFKISTAPDFFDAFTKTASNIPSIKGERPAIWLYIHGPTHQKALKLSREGDILLTAAEKFATIDAITDNSFNNYPQLRLVKAWEAKIYPDHGWGGNQGQITDDLFLQKFEYSMNEASQMLENATSSIASKIKIDSKKGIPVVIFNSLSWKRSDPVSFEMHFSEGKHIHLSVIDDKNNNVPVQLTNVNKYKDGSLKSVTVHFIAEDIPSIGYKTFFISSKASKVESDTYSEYETKYYKIKTGNGGLKQIYDKELDVNLLDNSKFLGGEVFTMKSKGTGAGEFTDIQQPTMDDFDKTGNYKTTWKLLENGAVFSSFVMRQQIKNATVEQRIILYKKLKRIDFDLSLLNWEGVLYREYRFALPVNMKGQVAYEVPFGVTEVGNDEIKGAAGERHKTPSENIHPRGIENWIGVNNDKFGLTLSSSVAVADYIDPTDNPVKTTVLQPILIASRRSCHELGNEYLQTGNHHFLFSLKSHQTGWKNGFRSGKQANEKLQVVVNPKPYATASLPLQNSFFSVKGKNAIISSIKKADDDNSLILRIFDISGKDTKIQLSFPKHFKTAIQTNLIEEKLKKLELNKNKLNINLGHHSIETINLK